VTEFVSRPFTDKEPEDSLDKAKDRAKNAKEELKGDKDLSDKAKNAKD